MSTPSGEGEFLHELERNVQAELAQAEDAVSEADMPVDEWLFDPADAQLEEVRLRSLLGAVTSMEAPPPEVRG